MTTPAPSPAKAGGSKSRRATPYLVKVEPSPPAPLLRVFVPGNPVSANHMHDARGYGAARRLTPDARAWRDAIALSVMRWRFAAEAPRPNLAVSLVWIGARSDIDNPVKLALDGVKLGLAVDDRYVTRLTIEKRPLAYGDERGAWIEVTELPPMHAQRAPRKARNKRTA